MNLEVQPQNWVLPNRIGYNKYTLKTFHPTKYPKKQDSKQGCACSNDVCEIPSETVSLFPQQRIVRDFIQVNSPYRGILLYHELGSGKSAASIAAAEGYVGKKKVFVMTPASLAQNYENELMKISKIGLNMKKSWTQLKVGTDDITKKLLFYNYAITHSIIKKDGLVWVPLYNDDLPYAVTVIKEKKYSTLAPDERNKIDMTMSHIIKNRYSFISYNGLTQKMVKEITKVGFDNSFVIIDEVHNFISRVVNGSKLARSIYNSIMSAIDCKLVLLSGTPIINNPYEVATLVNLIRGPMKVYELKLLKNSIEPTVSLLKDNLLEKNLMKYVDELYFNQNEKTINLSLLPEGFVRKPGTDIENILEVWNMKPNVAINKIIEAFNGIDNLRVGKISASSSYYALPNKKEDFDDKFIDTSDIENPKTKNLDLFQRRILGSLSYYKTTGTEYFPTVTANNIQLLSMTNHQLHQYADVRIKERSMDNAKKIHNRGALSEKSSVYRAFSRMICNFAFPENIKRVFPQDVRRLHKLMNKQLDADDDSDDEEVNDKEQKLLLKKTKEDYESILDKAVNELVAGDYLDREKLKTLYSPKYAKMLEDVEGSPGSVLIYSQFRSIEGLGIFSKVLDRDGYIEIVVKKLGEEYFFEDLSIFDKKYDNKRYVIFNSDRTKTNILMNLFNGSFTLLPDSIKKQLMNIDREEGYKDQLYGKLVKIMMITQSGAEGISLKNVRRVLIMEYFWNAVRISQVIGRAVRTCSHEMLPVDQRNVEIFTYIMKFTKQQMEKDFTLRTLDKNQTTDQHILQIATKKEDIINQFLNMLKATSFDCIINSIQNKPSENGYKCYNWAINSNDNDLSYTQNILTDGNIQKHQKFQVMRKNKGIVVSRDGNKYVMLNNKLYDYFSYKNAGILIPI